MEYKEIELTNYKKGIEAETLACNYLVENGFRIIGKRIKTKEGEIDILAQANDKYSANDYYIFEVKTRTDLEKAAESVGMHQIQRSVNAFFLYAYENDIEFEQIFLKAVLIVGTNIQIVDIDSLD